MPAPTFARGFDDTLAALAAPAAMATPLRDAFADAAAEWADTALAGAPPFASGVCPDGRPVELSLRARADGRTDVRFIAQPWAPGVPDERRCAWAAERARGFMARWGGERSRARLESALAIYPTGPEPTFDGNFHLWLGLGADARGQRAAKVYFNPWACRSESRGALALHHLLATSGVAHAGLESLLPWLQPEVGGTPHIVGWNVVGDRVASVKLYVQAVVDARRLAQVAPAAWAPWAGSAASLRPRGEVHVALTHDGEGHPAPRLNLFCPDWFRSDADVLVAVRAFAPTAAEALSRVLAAADRPGRRFNFVALDPDAVTVYFGLG